MRPSVGGPRLIVTIPVFNEQKYVNKVLEEVRRYARDILVINKPAGIISALFTSMPLIERRSI